jgi:hypothetical protein
MTVRHERGHQALIAALAWIGTEPPPLDEPRLSLLLRRTADGDSGRVLSFWMRDEKLPRAVTHLGTIPTPSPETQLQEVGYLDWADFTASVLRQWQWEEEQGMAPATDEEELRRRENSAALRHSFQRRRQCLDKLTQDPFAADEWTDEEEARMLRRLRRLLRDTITTLTAPGVIGDEVAKLDALQAFIHRCNDDQEAIDTIEREHIIDVFDELVYLAGLEDYGDALFDPPWRDF